MEIEKLLALRSMVEFDKDHHLDTWQEDMVLQLIDAEIERQEPCDACNNGDHGTKFKINIEFGKRINLNFHYCPTCGRKLGDE